MVDPLTDGNGYFRSFGCKVQWTLLGPSDDSARFSFPGQWIHQEFKHSNQVSFVSEGKRHVFAGSLKHADMAAHNPQVCGETSKCYSIGTHVLLLRVRKSSLAVLSSEPDLHARVLKRQMRSDFNSFLSTNYSGINICSQCKLLQ